MKIISNNFFFLIQSVFDRHCAFGSRLINTFRSGHTDIGNCTIKYIQNPKMIAVTQNVFMLLKIIILIKIRKLSLLN